MELDAFEFVAAVAQTHDDAVAGFGGDGEFARQRFALDDERMIARGGEGVGKFSEDALGVVMDAAGFAVEELGCANHSPPERRADGLVSEANTENGKSSGETLDQLNANPRVLGSAGTRGDDDAFRLAARDFVDGNLIVAMDFHLAAQLAEILRQVIGKRIVVVEQQDHDAFSNGARDARILGQSAARAIY